MRRALTIMLLAAGLVSLHAKTVAETGPGDEQTMGSRFMRLFDSNDTGVSNMRRALLGSVFLGLSCGLLGSFIVVRRMALLGDTISHAVLPGLMFGFLATGIVVTGVGLHVSADQIINEPLDSLRKIWVNDGGLNVEYQVQALTKNRSDLVGRHLSGYGGMNADELRARRDAGIVDARSTRGKDDNATYVVFGFLQPFPNKIFEIEFATLLDVEGGIFAQPGLRWNPGKGVTVEGFYNYVNSELWGQPLDNLISTLNFAEEFTLRLTYQF